MFGAPSRKIRGIVVGGYSGFSEYWTYPSSISSGEELLLRRLRIPPQGVVFDVGANLGLVALLLDSAHERITVRAFEPHPLTFAKLIQNVSLNGSGVICHQVALGNIRRTATFRAETMASAISRLSTSKDVKGTANVELIEVEVDTIDAFCATAGVDRIRLLKIDVEGFELDVLLGTHRMLERSSVDMVYFELCRANAALLEADAGAAASYLEEQGFSLFEIAPSGSLLPTVSGRAAAVELSNWLAVRDGVDPFGEPDA